MEFKPTIKRIEIFHQRYVIREDGCWEWTHTVTKKGYGHFSDKHKVYGAHRYSYMIHKGVPPEGLVLDHLCRFRRCVNPDHLEVVTNYENILRGNLIKTHCINGHEYSEENTGDKGNGNGKYCKICKRKSCLDYYHRKAKKSVSRAMET